MSLTTIVVAKTMDLQSALVGRIDPCLLDDKTSVVAQDVFKNLQNFALGTGKWIALAVLVVGVVAYLFGYTTLVKRGAIGVLALAFLGAIIAVASGLIGNSAC